jgi:hypothetical protein
VSAEATRTPGPWRATASPNDACCWDHHVEAAEAKDHFDQPIAVADVAGKENAEFIARAPQVEEALIEAVKALKVVRSGYGGLLDKATDELVAAAIAKAGAAGVQL